MNAPRIAAFTATALVAAFCFGSARAVAGTYTQMAPLSQYLMTDRAAEIVLARTAAPPTISGTATVLALTPKGYEVAAQGANGFTCLVERSWMDPFDNPDFWNPKQLAPVCYNAAASRSVLQYTTFRTKLVLEGVGKDALLERYRTAIANHQLPPAEAGSMAYMMSSKQYLGDRGQQWLPHVMFYAPENEGDNKGEGWGANRMGSPVVFDSLDQVMPEPWAQFFVPVAKWSDGSPSP